MKNEHSAPKNLLCFSHLRWDFVFQRPQHILSRFAADVKVFFMEEPVFAAGQQPRLLTVKKSVGLTVLVPYINEGQSPQEVNATIEKLLANFLLGAKLEDWTFWYYTPLALQFSRHFKPALTVFDCMDELSAFRYAPESLKMLEKELLAKADVVFTGGYSLYVAKKTQHDNIWPVPSSIEKEHFMQARQDLAEPADQQCIEGFKIGFYGVIDERLDLDLIAAVANERPDWQIILIGPVVKIDPATLPKAANIHYLGQKKYAELPAYLRGWDVAWLPFAINESTQFISPTKTPEYLAGGKPVVSSAIRDVAIPYGQKKLVSIAVNTSDFISEIERFAKIKDNSKWLEQVDLFLKDLSWDNTQQFMADQMMLAMQQRSLISIAS